MKINFRKIFDRSILFVSVWMPLTLGIIGLTAILKSDNVKKAPQLVIEIPVDYEMNWINFYGATAKPSPLHWFHRCTYESSFFPKGTETDTLHITLLLRKVTNP